MWMLTIFISRLFHSIILYMDHMFKHREFQMNRQRTIETIIIDSTK